MKVSFKSIIQAYSGKDMSIHKVFVTPHNKNFSRLREYVYPCLSEHHHLTGAKLRSASEFWKQVHADFKEDLEIYAYFYNKSVQAENKQNVSAYNVFIMAVCKYSEPFTSLIGDGGVKSVIGANISEWIENGYLQLLDGVLFYGVSL